MVLFYHHVLLLFGHVVALTWLLYYIRSRASFILIQPIQHITQNPGETEKDITIRRLDRERFWMLELGTTYPYGLNDRLQHVGNVSHSSVRSRNNVLNLFNRHQRRKRSHGHRSNSSRTSEITLDLLRNLYNGG